MDNIDPNLLRAWQQFSSFIEWLFLFMIKFLAATFLFELLFHIVHFDFLSWIMDHTTFSLGGAAVVLIPAVMEMYKREESNRSRKERRRQAKPPEVSQAGDQDGPSREEGQHFQKKEALGAKAGRFVLSVCHTATKSGFCCLIGCCCLWGFMPACAAHFHPGAKLGGAFIHYVEEINQSEQQPVPPQLDNEPQKTAEPQPREEESKSPENLNFLEDPMCYKELTESDRDQVYFRTSEAKIKDWTDEDDVISTVTKYVKGLRAQKKPNKFDKDAPSFMQTEVSNANTDYDSMTCSAQLDKTISTHLEAWEHPKYGLAWLLTNEYQEYGDHYNAEKGHFETIEYYYGQSIIWAENALTFESATSDQVKTLLSYISYRYHDIADSAAEGSTVKQHATVLYNAFKSIQNLDLSKATAE